MLFVAIDEAGRAAGRRDLGGDGLLGIRASGCDLDRFDAIALDKVGIASELARREVLRLDGAVALLSHGSGPCLERFTNRRSDRFGRRDTACHALRTCRAHKEPVTKLEELAGTTIRVPELRVWIDFWQLLGANPTPLPYAEQYNALSTGVIEGLEADFFSIDGFNWYEQAPHLTLTSHWFLPKAVRVNAAWLDALSPELQDLVRETAQSAFARQREANREGMAAALAGLVESGVTVHEPSDAEKARWVEKASPLFEQFGEASPETAAMIEAIRSL